MSASSTALQNQPQETMLVQAAEAGDFGAVEALIAAGVDVNSANEHGTTALMAAAANGQLNLVSFLLENGADFKAKRCDGFDALALAVFYGHLGIVRELIGRGADPKASDRLGTSPEMWATVRGFHDIAQVLNDAKTINSAVAHQSEQSNAPSPELMSAQEPVVKENFFSDQELSDETLSQEATASTRVITQQPKVLGGENQPSSVVSTYVPKPRYYPKRKSQKLMTESSYVESAYVPKPRYHHRRKSRKIVRWLAYITSDWRRLTNLTLIVMLVSGLGTVAVLNLLGVNKSSRSAEPVIITEASASDDSHFNAQNDFQSSTPVHQIPSKRPESDPSAERSILAEKKSNDRQVDIIENSSRLRDVKSLPKSSKSVDSLPPKETRQKIQEGSRPAQSFKSSNLSAKSTQSTKAVGADREDRSGVKAPPNLDRIDSGRGDTFPSTPRIKTQRPRRVAGTNDRMAPATTSGRNTKGKVIQWP